MKRRIATLAAAIAVSMAVAAQGEASTGLRSTGASEQGGAVMTVDLQTAIDKALQYNKQLRNSALDRETYHQKVREARSQGLPQVNASLTGTTYFGKKMDFGGMDITMENSITLAATASWTFSMQQIASVKVAKIAERLTDQTVKQTELDVKANVADTYYAVMACERNLEIVKANLADMEDIAQHTEHCYEAGTVEKTDVDQIEINLTTLRNTLMSLERTLASTKRLLVLQMGVDISTQVEMAQKLDDYLAATGDSLDLSAGVLTNNADYQLLLLNREVTEETVKVRKFAYIPTLTASYQYSNALKGGFMNFDHVGNLTLTVPIFSGFARHSQVKQAKIDVKKNETNIALMEDNLAQNAEQYAFDLQTAQDAYNLQKENLEVARRVLDNYKNKYNQGALSSLGLTQANQNYLTAESQYASAALDLLTAQTKILKLYNML
ncbi:MAG: TolC family protein [Marinilabiliaceae bacterium]